MTRHLYIAGIDRYPAADDVIKIEQALTYEVDTCSFNVAGSKPAKGSEVIIEDDDAGRLFAGLITSVEIVDKDLQIWAIECDDYSNLLDRKLVVERYQGKTADWIFKDIAEKYCPDFTVEGVRSGAPEIEDTGSDMYYIFPSAAFKWLCEYVGWHWQPSYYKDLGLFSTDDLVSPAPLKLEPGGPFRFGGHRIDEEGGIRNRVYVLGGTMLSDPQGVERKADGVARIWNLPWGPHECSFKVGEVPVTLGIENVDKESDYDFLLNFSEKYIRCCSGTSTPAAGATMSLTAQQDIDVITMVEDEESQAAIAAIQGGDGVYEYVITDDSLVTIEAAEAAGLADLREHANPNVSGDFETEVDGWAPGQLVNIALPDRGAEGTFLIQRVTITPFNPSLWTYKIEYGGRVKGIADYLAALISSQQNRKTADTAILHKFVYGQEAIGVTDELITTPRTLPYVCGDPDAVCGLCVVADGEAPPVQSGRYFLTPNFPAAI